MHIISKRTNKRTTEDSSHLTCYSRRENLGLLSARRYASAGISCGRVSASVCLCVCLSHAGNVLYRNGRTDRAAFCLQVSLDLCYTVC